MNDGKIRYFSMFTGVGGFELGLEDKGECVGFSEIDKYCSELLSKRFPRITNFGDATKINPRELPDFDMLCGGFPCQAFSIAGKRRGFNDTRGTLFFEIARIIEVKRPKIIFLENVKGLLNHNKGETFSIIIQTLSELGYGVQWMVLNSKFFGVPQNRERVFIVGHIRGQPRPKVFPFTASSRQTDELQGLKVGAITARRGTAKSDGDYIVESIRQTQKNPQGMRVYGTDGVSTTIASQAGGLGAKTGLYKVDRKTGKIKDGSVSNTLQAKDGQSHSLETFIGKENMAIRRLTPTECERLQGFPDGWTEGFSDTQRYKMMGNAVTVNVIRTIGEKLLEASQEK